MSSGPRVVDGLRTGFALGVWFGLAEGLIRLVTRLFPALHAAHKVSVEVLWVAPALDVVLFTPVALLAGIVARRGGARLRRVAPGLPRGVLVALGIATLGVATAVLHPASVALLGLGGGALALRRSPRRTPSVLAPSVALLAALAGTAVWSPLAERVRAGHLPRPPAGARNVLVLMLDTVRWDSFQGEDAARLVPNLTRLAATGVRFERAWSVTSWSLPAQASLLTGAPPSEHGADWPALELVEGVPTLAERFAARGYATGAFSGNASWITPEYLGRGFLRFRVYVLEDLVRRTSLGKAVDAAGRAVSLYAAGRGKKAPRIRDELEGFLDAYAERPFFAYVCYMDVNQSIYARLLNHYFRRRAPYPEVERAYRDGLRTLDARIGELLEGLGARGILDETIILVTSDHGESFGPGIREDRMPRGHGTSLYPEQTRIPLFVVGPGIPAGGSVAGPSALDQAAATLAALAGLPRTDRSAPALPGLGTPSAPHEPVMTLRYEGRAWRALADAEWLWVLSGPTDDGELIAVGPADSLRTDPERARIELSSKLERLAPAPARGPR